MSFGAMSGAGRGGGVTQQFQVQFAGGVAEAGDLHVGPPSQSIERALRAALVVRAAFTDQAEAGVEGEAGGGVAHHDRGVVEAGRVAFGQLQEFQRVALRIAGI